MCTEPQKTNNKSYMSFSFFFKCRNSNFTNTKLKVVCGVLDLEKKGTHSDLVDRIMTYLTAPKNSGKVICEHVGSNLSSDYC